MGGKSKPPGRYLQYSLRQKPVQTTYTRCSGSLVICLWFFLASNYENIRNKIWTYEYFRICLN